MARCGGSPSGRTSRLSLGCRSRGRLEPEAVYLTLRQTERSRDGGHGVPRAPSGRLQPVEFRPHLVLGRALEILRRAFDDDGELAARLPKVLERAGRRASEHLLERLGELAANR